jgi:hypothetical protein
MIEVNVENLMVENGTVQCGKPPKRGQQVLFNGAKFLLKLGPVVMESEG